MEGEGVTGGRRSGERKRKRRKEGRRTLKATERGRELKGLWMGGEERWRDGEVEAWRGGGGRDGTSPS